MIKKIFFNLYKYLMPFRDKVARSRILIKLLFNVNVPLNYDVDFDMTTVVLKYALKKAIKSPTKVFEMGIGTGSLLSIFLAKKFNTKAYGADISLRRVKQSKEIAYLNKINEEFKVSNLFKNIDEKYELIIFNPPYVPSKIGRKLKLKDSFKNIEGNLAWDGGEEGTDLIKRFFNQVSEYITENGLVLIGVQGLYIKPHIMKKIIFENNLKLFKTFKLPFMTSVVYFVKK